MRPKREWILYFAALLCFLLVVVGGFSYPMINEGLATIVLYQVGIFLGILGILFLIYIHGLSESRPLPGRG